MLGLKNMSDTNKGIVFMIAGLALFLHTLGIFTAGLKYALILASLYMFAYGFIKVNGMKYVNKFLGRKD